MYRGNGCTGEAGQTRYGTTRANDEGPSRFSTDVAMDADRAGDVNTERGAFVHT
jgi:hypothetical protein